MRTHKKLLSVLVTLAMILSLIPTTALAAESRSGNVIEVSDTDELQAALDSCETNTTIQLKAGKEYGVVEVRPTASNETSMYCQTHDYGTDDAEAFAEHLEEPVYHCTPDYTTELKNVTIIGAEGATIAGFTASSGHTVGPAYDYVLDKDYPSGSVYYWTLNISNLTFKNVAFTGKIDINTSDEDSEYDGVTFDGCSFTTGGIVADNGPAIRYYNEANNGKSKNIVVKDCEFKNCYQGVYVHHVNGITVTDSAFEGTGHNAIAMQGHQGNVDLKDVVITGNTFKDINDRVIRFNNVGADSNITIQDNEATDSGDVDGQVMKATSIASGVTTSIGNNNWGDGKVVANDELKDEELVAQVGETKYTSLAAAVAAAKDGKTVTVLKHVTLTEALIISAGKTVVLDLNGKTISQTKSQTEAYAMLVNLGTLTIQDSVGTGKMTYQDTATYTQDPGWASDTILNHGTLTITGGTIENTSVGSVVTYGYPHAVDTGTYSKVYPISGDVTLNITGGTIKNAQYSAIRMFCNSSVYNTKCEISGTSNIVNAVDFQLPNNGKLLGELTISGGTFSTTEDGSRYAVRAFGFGNDASGMVLSITGGTFNAPVHIYKSPDPIPMPDNFNMKFISGGTFNTDPAPYLVDGYVAVENEGTFTVCKNAAKVTYYVDDEVYATETIDPLTEGAQFTKPAEDPTKAGYTFAGWYCEEECENLYDFEQSYASAGDDMSLYAGWDPIAVTHLELDYDAMELAVGATGKLTAEVGPANALEPALNWTSSNPAVATVDAEGNITAVSAGTAVITVETIETPFQSKLSLSCTVTVTANTGSGESGSSSRPSGGGSGGGSSAGSDATVTPNVTSPTVSTEKAENADGSTTVTETKKDGTIVETITNADGSTTVSASKSETVTNKTTGETTTTTATNTTTTTATGVKVTEAKVEETVKKADGTEVTTSTTETKSSDGSKSTATVDETGKMEAEVSLSSTAVKNAEKAEVPVALPMPAVEATKSSENAATIAVNVPASVDRVKVEIPVADVTPGTVVVLVDEQGNETIVPMTAQTENGLAIEVEGDVTVKVVDNSKDFGDVAENYALSDSIDFVSARGLFQGTSATTFNPHADTTRGQLMTVLARAAGADTTGTPIQKGMEWAKEMGISDGTNAGGSVTRQQLATMLWRLAGCPVPTNAELSGTDADQVAAYAKDAMAWCAEMGIMNGYANGSLGATKNASRAHVAAFVERYINAVQG